MSNRFAFVIVAIAVPIAGFYINKNAHERVPDSASTDLEKPVKHEFSPITKTPAAPDPEPEKPTRERHDQIQFDRFSGKPIPEIIAVLTEEKTTNTSETTAKPTFYDALPTTAFPFPADAEPRDKPALEEFIATIQQGSIDEPTLLNRWRINLAHVALGTYPDAVPDHFLLPDLTQNASEQFPVRFKTVATPDFGAVFAVADFDSDGRDDIIGNGGVSLWKSITTGPAATGLPAANGLFPADFDGDGDVDLFATRTGGFPNSLWINEGDGTFTDFTEAAGLLAFADTRAAAWGDFDRDGKLDLAVGNVDAPLEIYHANGNGTFDFAVDRMGFTDSTQTLALASVDTNGDGKIDLFTTTPEMPALHWNAMDSTSVFADFDNDGDLDLVLASRSQNSEGAFLTTLADDELEARLVRFFQNDGEGKFTDFTAELALPDLAGATSLAAIDLDADGFEDLLVGTGGGVPNRVFWNRDGLAFREATVASGLGFLTAASAITRGDFGIITGRAVVAATPPAPQLTIHLEKNSAGAKINIVTRDRDWVLHSFHRVANGYQPTVIGLGDAKTIESIELIWPETGTAPSKFSGKKVPLDSEIAIERGSNAVIVLDE